MLANATTAAITPQTAPLLVSRERASELLSVGISQIDKLLRTGALPCHKIGRRVLIPMSALERIAADCAAAQERD